MKNINSILTIAILSLFALIGCGDNELETTVLDLNVSGLENLGPDFAYEGWIIVDGAPVTTGIFNVDDSGTLSSTSFEVNKEAAQTATAFVLTIEPSPDPDPAPSDVHILAGDLDGDSGFLSVEHGAAIGTDFTSANGGYILATPTDGGSDTDERSGVWFLDLAAGPAPALDLPTLPAGWIYEGWAVIDGTPVSTGRFSEVSGADDVDGFSGDAGGPPFPGEDFLVNAPAGLSFPTDLAGKTVVISVEPVPDNSPAPFLLKPLVGQVPATATDHTLYDLGNNAVSTNPTGNVNINE